MVFNVLNWVFDSIQIFQKNFSSYFLTLFKFYLNQYKLFKFKPNQTESPFKI